MKQRTVRKIKVQQSYVALLARRGAHPLYQVTPGQFFVNGVEISNDKGFYLQLGPGVVSYRISSKVAP